MPECPRCGTKVYIPTKTWSMVGKASKRGERFKLTLGLFRCQKCEKGFREVLGKEKVKVTLKGMVNEVKEIERRLVQTLGDLTDKIEKLKIQKVELLNEIEGLKRAGEKKADTLEKEIATIREEVESLKEMLGLYY